MDEDEQQGTGDAAAESGANDQGAAALAAAQGELEATRAALAAAQAERDSVSAVAEANRAALEADLAAARVEAEASRAARADALRRAVLAENRGQVIDELIAGETEEELAASVAIAKGAYSRAVEAARAQIAATVVPAGASARDVGEPENLTALERITRGIAGARNGAR